MAFLRRERASGIERLTRAGRTQGLTAIERTIAAGEVVFRQGDAASDMYLVQSGRVELRHRSAHGERVLHVIERGDFFGEMAVLEAEPRTATAIALEASVLIELGAGALLMRIRRDPTLAIEMLQRLSGRIRVLNDTIAASTPDRDPVYEV